MPGVGNEEGPFCPRRADSFEAQTFDSGAGEKRWRSRVLREPVAKGSTQFAGGGGREGQGLSLSHGGSIWDVRDD